MRISGLDRVYPSNFSLLFSPGRSVLSPSGLVIKSLRNANAILQTVKVILKSHHLNSCKTRCQTARTEQQDILPTQFRATRSLQSQHISVTVITNLASETESTESVRFPYHVVVGTQREFLMSKASISATSSIMQLTSLR